MTGSKACNKSSQRRFWIFIFGWIIVSGWEVTRFHFRWKSHQLREGLEFFGRKCGWLVELNLNTVEPSLTATSLQQSLYFVPAYGPYISTTATATNACPQLPDNGQFFSWLMKKSRMVTNWQVHDQSRQSYFDIVSFIPPAVSKNCYNTYSECCELCSDRDKIHKKLKLCLESKY